jgi:hypothetical protein
LSPIFGEIIFKPITSVPGVDVKITIFCDFANGGFFSKTNVGIKLLQKLAVV